MHATAEPIYRIEALRLLEQRHADAGLMERAGAAAAAWAEKICKSRGRPILIVAGPGNNGGDALVVARCLIERGLAVSVVFAGTPDRLPAEAGAALARLLASGSAIGTDLPAATRWDLVVDGLFGVGLARPVAGRFAELIRAMQQAAHDSDCPLLALDCPSGLDADTGRVLDVAITASHTLSFLGLKPGLLTADGPDHCGEVRVDTLGVAPPDPDALAAVEPHPVGSTVGLADFASALRPRLRNSHKGSFGSAGILGGAPGMVGAPLLAGRAALKIGTGRVYLGIIDRIALRVDLRQPELMMRSPEALFEAPLSALAIGPGLGHDDATKAQLVNAITVKIPLVIDADGLNLLGADPSLSDLLAQRTAPTVLTPHPAEAGRLLGLTVEAVQADRMATAHLLAQRYRAWVVLKGCGSVIASPSGQWWINTTGNPGLASAGTGDVLTGLIAGLLAQGWPVQPAVLAATHLHGAAADQWVARAGPIGLCASDIAEEARRLINRWVADACPN